MRPDYAGIVELPRSLLLTPVWASQTAWRVFSWILLSAARDAPQESVYGHTLGRGQFSASQQEISRGSGLSKKSVQTALRLLEAERFITRDKTPGRSAAVYTVCEFFHRQGETVAGAGNGDKTGALLRADSGQYSGHMFDAGNSSRNNRMDADKCRSGNNTGAVNGAINGADAGAATGESTPDGMPKRPEPPKSDVPPGKPVRWRWTCGTCGADSVGMIPAGVVPAPVPCLKSKWGRCDGMAHPERDS